MNINNTFFAGSYKEAWRSLIPAGLTEAETDFLQEMGALKPESRVLDLMCGYGRHAIELGKRGVNVMAVDNLPEYIEEIQSIALEQSLPVNAAVADVLRFNPEDIYDAIICMGNSFAFFDRADALTILKSCSGRLKAGGCFVIDSWMIAEIAIRHFREKEWYYAGEYRCLLDYRYHFQPSRIESEQTLIAPDGSLEVLKGVDYIFSLDELEAMFREAGLRTAGLYSTPRKKKFVLGDSRIYIVAEKL